jgi:hypothetical protein
MCRDNAGSARHSRSRRLRSRFSLTASGTKLLQFRFSSQACAGSFGLTHGVNYLLQPQNVYKITTIKVSSSGKFSIKHAKYWFKQNGSTTTTTMAVTSSFITSTKATGTISYKQKTATPGVGPSTCGPSAFTFSAKLK